MARRRIHSKRSQAGAVRIAKAKARFSHSKIEVVHYIYDNLNEIFFDNMLPEAGFVWLSPVSFKRTSWVDADCIHLHPKLVVPEWKDLLEFEIYKSMLMYLDWEDAKGVNSLEFRRAEASIGHLPKRLEQHRKFLTSLFKKHAKHLRKPQPRDSTLYLFICKVCGSGAARLSEERAICEYCKLKLPVQMRGWDQIDFKQHYKFSVSPLDYMKSEHSHKKLFLMDDSFLRHFVS